MLGGEQQPSAELMELSTRPVGIAAEAHRYLAEGGPANLGQLHAFLSDTVLLTGEGFEPPAVVPQWGMRWFRDRRCVPSSTRSLRCEPLARASKPPSRESGSSTTAPTRPAATPASRTRWSTRSTRPAQAVGVPVFAGSLRSAPDELYDALGTLDALMVTVLAAGGSKPAGASAGGDDEAWDVERMARARHPHPARACA